MWYAAYGSNLDERRFLAYLRGGAVPGAPRGTSHSGARDPAVPRAAAPVTVPLEAYFARSSSTWGGGVAFVDTAGAPSVTLGRGYLITATQLVDVYLQENRLRPGDRPDVDAAVTGANLGSGETLDLLDGWYGRLVCLDPLDGVPVVTITARPPAPEPAMPSPAYLGVLAAGLAQTYGHGPHEAARYLARWPGNLGRRSVDEIASLLEATR